MSNSTLPILLVDDEQQILFSYSLMLRSAGIENILTIQDSRQVSPLLERQDVAVIVLDLIMPYISGTELLTKIKLLLLISNVTFSQFEMSHFNDG